MQRRAMLFSMPAAPGALQRTSPGRPAIRQRILERGLLARDQTRRCARVIRQAQIEAR